MDDPALAARVEQVNLFCRVAPAQKNRVILALKRRGHVVGYLGDGINDAPSLHSAETSAFRWKAPSMWQKRRRT